MTSPIIVLIKYCETKGIGEGEEEKAPGYSALVTYIKTLDHRETLYIFFLTWID